MKVYEKSHKLDHVCYDIRGPIMEEANRMIAGGEDVLKLNIGNPAYFGFRTPEVLLDYMADKLPDTEGYSDSHGLVSAREAICEYCREKGIPNVGINDVFTGNGVSELITLSMQGLLDNGDEVLVPTPDYPLWTASVTLAGGKAVHYICDEQSNWYPDIEDMRRKVTDKTKGIVVINPNNPTGTAIRTAEMREILAHCKKIGASVMIDETYIEFSDILPEICSIPLVKEFDNLFVIRGTSKFFAAPGIRLGYGISSNQAFLDRFKTNTNPWSVNSLADFIGQHIFTDFEFHKKTQALVSSERRKAFAKLSTWKNIKAYPSEANFILLKLKTDRITAHELFEKCIQKKMLIRDASSFTFLDESYLRFCILSPEHNAALLAELKKWVEA